MVDVMSADKRSALMSRIRSKNTGPELIVRKLLWHAGLRYRLHNKRLPGKPDLVLPRWKVAVFIHGCFWHRHAGCPYFRLPKTRASFWDKKLAQNHNRDSAAATALIKGGWRVAVVWECAVRASPDATRQKLLDWMLRKRTGIQLTGSLGTVQSCGLDGLTSNPTLLLCVSRPSSPK